MHSTGLSRLCLEKHVSFFPCSSQPLWETTGTRPCCYTALPVFATLVTLCDVANAGRNRCVCCLQLKGEVWVAESPLQPPGTSLLFEVRGDGNPTMLLCPRLCHGALLSIRNFPRGNSDLEPVCSWD